MKICPRCKVNKDESEYYAYKKQIIYCKSCKLELTQAERRKKGIKERKFSVVKDDKKLCLKCDKFKLLDQFSAGKRLGSKCAQCKTCREKTRKLWLEQNRERNQGYAHNYRTKKANVKSDMPKDYMKILKQFYGNQCLFPDCKSTQVTLDHVKPISLGGEHTLVNSQLLCKPHNSQKRNRNSADYRKVILSLDYVNMLTISHVFIWKR